MAGLRQAIGPLDDGLIEAMTRAVVGELCRSGQFTRVQTALRRSSHVPSLPPHLRAAGGRLREALAADPLNPPSRKQLASDSTAEQALRFLISNGEAIEISRDCVISSMALEKAIERIRLELEGGPRSVSQLRQAVGSSRRIMVPLLERLDRDGVTRRDGDLRRLAR